MVKSRKRIFHLSWNSWINSLPLSLFYWFEKVLTCFHYWFEFRSIREVKKQVKAIAYVDRNHKETILTKIAKDTYMKDAKVKSFNNEQDALNWLAQFGSLPTE